MYENHDDQLEPYTRMATPLEFSGSEADVLLQLIATRRPLRHVLGFFFEEGFAQALRVDEQSPPGAPLREQLLSGAVSELLTLSHEPPSYYRVARRGKLLGILVAAGWTSMDTEAMKIGEAVLATAGVGEELSKGQQHALLIEIERVPSVAHPGAVRWALEQILHESLEAEDPS